MIPAFTMRSMASLRASDFPPPILKLRTACVFGFGFVGERIQSSAAMIPEYEPRPSQLRSRMGTIVAFLAIPYWVPAIVVETCVP